MVRTIFLISGTAGWLSSVAFVAAATPPRRLAATDQTFLTTATIINNYQMSAARLAQAMSPSDSDRDDAKLVALEESKFGGHVQRAATLADATFRLPSGLDSLHQRMLATLRNAGPNFSAEYAKQMTASHIAERSLYRRYLMQPDADRRLQAVISGEMPTVEVHLQMAKALAQR